MATGEHSPQKPRRGSKQRKGPIGWRRRGRPLVPNDGGEGAHATFTPPNPALISSRDAERRAIPTSAAAHPHDRIRTWCAIPSRSCGWHFG